jgi:hypothetical protein
MGGSKFITLLCCFAAGQYLTASAAVPPDRVCGDWQEKYLKLHDDILKGTAPARYAVAVTPESGFSGTFQVSIKQCVIVCVCMYVYGSACVGVQGCVFACERETDTHIHREREREEGDRETEAGERDAIHTHRKSERETHTQADRGTGTERWS